MLHAYNPDKNIDRVYMIQWGRTLFEEVFLNVQWGRRSNKKLCTKTYYYKDINELSKELKRILHKRFTSYKRLGVNYQLIEGHYDGK